MRKNLSLTVLLAYAFPAFVTAIPVIPVFIHLPTLYGAELGLGLAVTGLVILGARIFDTVTDPIIGWLSDRFGFRGTRRKPWIAIGSVIAAVGLYKVLNPPSDVTASYLLIWSVVLYAGWTMVTVPYTAWAAELTQDYDERTNITSMREAAALFGILVAGVLNFCLVQVGMSQTAATGALAWFTIGAGAIFITWMLRVVPDPWQGQPQRSEGLSALWQTVKNNGLFKRLILAWFLNGLANGIPAALFFLYLEYGLGVSEDTRPLFILAYFFAAIAAIPIWQSISARHGKSRTWCYAMVLACVSFVFVPLIPEGGQLFFMVVCILTGAALGADLALPPSIQADVVDYGHWRTGARRTGLLFAFWSMSSKLSLALAVGVALPGVETLGFTPENPTEQGILGLVVIYSLVPVVFKVLAIATIWRFPLSQRKHAAVLKRLDKKRFNAESLV